MFIVALILLGLCFGSFVNALVWRIHSQPNAKSLKLKAKDLSIAHGRSICVHCHHTLAWYDLLPVVSWLILGGKCRYCGKPISIQYPAVELLTATLFVVSYVYWPSALIGVGWLIYGLWLVLLTGFMALVVYDIKWMLLPNRIVFPLQAVAALFALVMLYMNRSHLGGTMFDLAAAIVLTAGLFATLFYASKGTWIGGGDVKLAVVLGLVLADPIKALLMIFLASVLGSLWGLPALLGSRKARLKVKIPFGPFLIIATIVVYLFGSLAISWYNQLLFA